MLVPRRSLLAFAVLLLAPSLRAQDKDLPKAEEILDKYVDATGGKAAYEKLKNRHSKGKIEIVGLNVTGTVEIYQEAPKKLSSVTVLEGAGTITQGTDGTIAWSIDPNTGERLLEGPEKVNFIRDATFNSEANWREEYKTVETVGLEDVDGKPAYKLTLTPNEGTPLTSFYDKESGLLVKISQIAQTPQGEIPVDSTPGDYREVDGVKMPFTTTQALAGIELKISVDEVKHNVEIPAETFAVPEAIKKLQETK